MGADPCHGRVMMVATAHLRAERVDWVEGRLDPHWMVRDVWSTPTRLMVPVRECPDGLQAIRRYQAGEALGLGRRRLTGAPWVDLGDWP